MNIFMCNRWRKELVAHAKRNGMSIKSVVLGRIVFWFRYGYGRFIWDRVFNRKKIYWEWTNRTVDIRPTINGKKKPFIVDIFEAWEKSR